MITDLIAWWNPPFKGLLNIMFLIHEFKFQKGCLPYKINSPLRVLDPWELNEDAVFPLATYVGFSHAKLVNTVSDSFHGLFRCHFFNIGYFLIG